MPTQEAPSDEPSPQARLSEVSAAREIARMATGLLAAFDELEQTALQTARLERPLSCLLCAREAPPDRGPRCGVCGGVWI